MLTKFLQFQKGPNTYLPCVEHSYFMWSMTGNISKLVLTKPHSCQQGHKMHLNMCWPIRSHACEKTKHISTCVDQTYLYAIKEIKCISTCVEQTPSMSKHEFTKSITSQKTLMYLNLCWQNPSHARDNRNCISTCVEKSLPCQRGQNKCISKCAE